jgi:hypothetical protein
MRRIFQAAQNSNTAPNLVSHHAVPVFQNSHGRVVVPMRQILQASQNSNTAPKANTGVDSSTKAQADTSALKSKIDSSTIETKGKVSQCTNTPSLGVVLLPFRLLKLSVAAWVLAEILDQFGILNEYTPSILKSQFHRVWYDVQPKFHRVWYDVQPKVQAGHEKLGQWWSTTTQERLPGMPPKYQFAIGASLGMIASPLLATVTFSLWQPAVLLYGLSELNAHFKAKGKLHLGAILGNGKGGENLVASLESLLDRVRQWVRGCFLEAPTSGALLDTSGGGNPGYCLGVSSYSSSTVEPQIRHLRQKIKDFGHRVVDSSEHSLVEFKERIESPDNNNSNIFVEMIRHGLVVGSAIGLLVGV